MVLIVLRHGQSKWNKENRFTGWENISLSSEGENEAKIAGNLLKSYSFDYVITSDLKRTIETYDIIKSIMKLPEANNTQLFKERDYGDLTGKNKTQLEELYGKDKIHNWRRSYTDRPPNGENLDDVRKRVGLYYDTLKSKKNILIIAHGNSLRALFVHLGLKDENSIASFEIPTGIPININVEEKTFSYVNSYKLQGRQILDSRGFPTIEVKCIDVQTGKCVGKGACPSGSSCGSKEAIELRDGDKSTHQGKGVLKAIDNIHKLNDILMLNYNTVTNLKKIDEQMICLDPSIGGNTITAISMCMMNVGANLLDIEMYEYISQIYGFDKTYNKLPTIMANIINGGIHCGNQLMIQEFMIVPREDISVDKRVQIICEVYHTLEKLLEHRYSLSSTNVGFEGGFTADITNSEDTLNIIEEAITKAGYVVANDVYIALDCAASEFYNEETKLYEIEKDIFLNSDDLITYYGNLIDKHPALKSIEDPFHESDFNAWIKFMKLYSDKIMIVADDITCTNKALVKEGLDNNWMNFLLVKVNQIGTITEAIEASKMMFDKGFGCIISHRSKDVEYSNIIDIAVGIHAQYVKIGAPCRSERTCKYNRLLEIKIDG